MTLEQRLWSRVRVSGPDACWPWTGSHANGYGQFMVSGRMYRTHRLSWELANGPIPDGLWVLHTCDNPPCVNPAHLFLGTAADNNADMIAKGRHAQQIPAMRGEGNPSAKLRAADVRAIRARVALGASQAATARQFGVSRSLVNQVVRGHVWTTTAAA